MDINQYNNSKITKNNSDLPINNQKLYTLNGSYSYEWETDTPISINGHNAIFNSFLESSGLLEHLIKTCPIKYTSHNAPTIRDFVSTIVLSILNGYTRYRHIDKLCNDDVTAELYKMKKIMSSDSIRRGIKKIDEKEGNDWIRTEIFRTCEPLLDQEYILDLDPTVKVLYGHQEGAEIGYNPQKPGRPSYCYHTLNIAALRLVVGVIPLPGKQTAGVHSKELLENYFDWILPRLKPKFTRGDVGFGNETMIHVHEKNNIHYLFKIRRSPGVRKLWKTVLAPGIEWEDAGQGWQGYQSTLRLMGWTKERNVILIRRKKSEKAIRKLKEKKNRKTKKTNDNKQLLLSLDNQELLNKDDLKFEEKYDWCVLVTDLDLPIISIAQLYRDRGDCENIFDEMKNQWGWNGFTTNDMKSSCIMAQLVAIVANWWNIFIRMAVPDKHLEGKRSRALFQQIIEKIAKHGNGRKLIFYIPKKEKIKEKLNSIILFLNNIRTATQFDSEERWLFILDHAFRNFPLKKSKFPPEIKKQLMLLLQ